MELTLNLEGRTIQNRIREVGINPNYWYPVSWSDRLKLGEVIPVQVWKMPIAVYRDRTGKLHALEDACPHKGVSLHLGDVIGENLACPYHGWQFDENGNCVSIPYLPPGQKLPCAKARSYPIREKYNIIWIFPGDTSALENTEFPEIPEYNQPGWLVVPIPGDFKAHFSICNENTMDVFHGYLHRNLQGWFDPVLINLRQDEVSVFAQYRVSYQGWMTKFLGLSENGNQVTTRTISVKYNYPHYQSTLEGVSSLYLMRLPVGPQSTRSFALMFLKLRLPEWLLKPIQRQVAKMIWRLLFKKFLDQDVEMMESEQRTYQSNTQRRYVEINPAIFALQRVIVGQYEKFMQQSKQSLTSNNDKYKEPSHVAEAFASD
ncbi:MAG: aromatic ring-hydroxylating dioxygenase subunit alpha [Cyanobacteria bacterium P01_A01_bin.84]